MFIIKGKLLNTNMRIKQKKNQKRKWPYVVIGSTIIILLAAGTYLYVSSKTPTQDTPTTPTTISPTKGGEQNNSEGSPTQEDDTQKSPHNNESESDGIQNSSTLILNTEVSSGHIKITTQITEIWSSGTCVVTLKNGDQTISKEAPIQALSSYSTCQGFNINLPNGTWSLDVTATSQEKTASAQAEVIVK